VRLCAEPYDDSAPLNLGRGPQTSIGELASLIRGVVGYRAELCLDGSKLGGTPFRGLDPMRLRDLGWRPSVELREGRERTYRHVVFTLPAPRCT
jgi:GDP-L-fucose synthase